MGVSTFVGFPSNIHPSSPTVPIKVPGPTKPALSPLSISLEMERSLAGVNPACSSQSVASPIAEPGDILSSNASGSFLCYSLHR